MAVDMKNPLGHIEKPLFSALAEKSNKRTIFLTKSLTKRWEYIKIEHMFYF
jgi:hypothetical protein